LLKCNIYAKTLKKIETLNSKPQKLEKMELWKWILEVETNQQIKSRFNLNLLKGRRIEKLRLRSLDTRNMEGDLEVQN
jgi:hypothetical protein